MYIFKRKEYKYNMEKRTSKDVVVGAKFGRWTVLELDVKNPNTKAKNPPRFVLC